MSATFLEIANKGSAEPIGFVLQTPKSEWISLQTGDTIQDRSHYDILSQRTVNMHRVSKANSQICPECENMNGITIDKSGECAVFECPCGQMWK